MRFLKRMIFMSLACAMTVQPVFADTLLTAPLDGRPVSIEYLENLTELSGDAFLSVDKQYLDYFSGKGEGDHFADSGKVRQEIARLVEENNKEDTIVIINSASYLTGGLVGSRCAPSYDTWQADLEELHALITEYQKPAYYINLAMPRNLPETRNHAIWPDTDKQRGLAYYYLKYNKDAEGISGISGYEMVAPEQFLMEWAYVENKRTEMGQKALTKWEADFLTVFEAKYQGNPTYDPYITSYRMPHLLTANILYHLLQWQKEGLIEEIVISNDDLELPKSIDFLYKNTNASWIPEERGAAVKFSFARTYMTEGINSVYRLLVKEIGEDAAQKALRGEGEYVNFIFGMDEAPQLIYARVLSKRTGLSADFTAKGVIAKEGVGSYDVLDAKTLLDNAIRFVSAGSKKTAEPVSLYLYDYHAEQVWDLAETRKAMDADFEKGNAVGLIEIFSLDIPYGAKQNRMFQSLLSEKKADRLSFPKLASYSAWNTNANAVGLSVAHSQVYAIAKETAKDPEAFLAAQAKILAVHGLEDGFYIAKGKQVLSRAGYVPDGSLADKEKLLSVMPFEQMRDAFLAAGYEIDGKTYAAEEGRLLSASFPWGRLFDCYLELEFLFAEKQAQEPTEQE